MYTKKGAIWAKCPSVAYLEGRLKSNKYGITVHANNMCLMCIYIRLNFMRIYTGTCFRAKLITLSNIQRATQFTDSIWCAPSQPLPSGYLQRMRPKFNNAIKELHRSLFCLLQSSRPTSLLSSSTFSTSQEALVSTSTKPPCRVSEWLPLCVCVCVCV